jgi:uncharacterized protein (TIGR02302 family)
MQNPFARNSKTFDTRITRITALTSVLMYLEQFAAAFWPPISWVLFFLTLWLLQIPNMLGAFGYEIAFIVGFVGLAFWIYKGLGDFKRPTKENIARRIERYNALAHRPLSQQDDTLANPEKEETRATWVRYKQSLQGLLKNIKTPSLESQAMGRDPYALRFAVFFLFVTASVMAGGQWGERVHAGLTPFSLYKIPGFGLEGATITITPPEYTGYAPVTLKGRGGKQIVDIPVGSHVRAQVQGGIGTPVLVMGDTKYHMQRLQGNAYGYDAFITNDTRISIRQAFLPRVNWRYNVIDDTPPAISTTGEPEITEYQSIRLPITVLDDYGVRDIAIRMTLNPVVSEAPLGEVYTEKRAVMSAPGQETELSPVFDLTWHTWAGLPVILKITAIDAIGNKASQDIEITLPERSFSHPLAKKLIEHRKFLAWNPEGPYEEMRDSLYRLQTHPDDYDHDLVILMALRTAAARLYFSPGLDTAKALIKMFWDVAVHLEDGDINLALRQLQEAQRNLEQALSDPNASDEEVARKVEELRQAMANYFREMARELHKRMAEGKDMPLMPPQMFSQMLDAEQLSQFFDQLQSEALDNPDKARELLSQLNKLLDMMNPNFSQTMPMDMQMMAEGVSELQQLVRRQEELLDQTRTQQALKEEQPTAPPPDTSTNKVEQDALRYVLGQLMLDADEQIGEIPESMGLAEQEMRHSSSSLDADNPGGSIPHQEQAIEHLRDSMQSLSQQLAERMQQMTGFMLGQGATDPLGRPRGDQDGGNSFFSGSGVKIPDEAERKRVQEILRQLREKSGEYERPREEREYYRRLLKQF